MTYWEIFYGKCKEKSNGSPDCCAYCKICLGANWKPHGFKSFEQHLKWFLEEVKCS